MFRDETMIQHLAGETALEVKDHRPVQQCADYDSDQGAFVEIGVDQVWPEAQCSDQRRGGQHRIQGQLQPG